MSIHAISGKPGGGKGDEALRRIINELRFGERPVVTNFAIRLSPWVRQVGSWGRRKFKPEIGLRAYLLQTYGKDFDCDKRVFALGESEARTFYLRRVTEGGECVTLDHSRDESNNVTSFVQTDATGGGILYVLDECWRDFGSRDWQTTGKGLIFYNAQHRKFGDTVLFVTQHTKQVETALRQMAQDFAVVVNMSKRKLGLFRQAAIFLVITYAEPPTGIMSEPLSREFFTLDKAGLGGCFDTSAGIGVSGGSAADIFERAKGLPWWLIPLLFIALAIGIFYVGSSVPALTKYFYSSRMTKASHDSTNSVLPSATNAVPARYSGGGGRSNSIPVVSAQRACVSGAVGVGARRVFFFNDGSVSALGAGITYASESFVVFGGVTCRWCRVAGAEYSDRLTNAAASDAARRDEPEPPGAFSNRRTKIIWR